VLAQLSNRLARRPPSAFFAKAEPGADPAPARRYLIATTPRSGSPRLCARIAEYEVLGFPMGFLNLDYIGQFDRLFPNPSLDDFERYIQRAFAAPGAGPFGLETDWWHFSEARQLGVLAGIAAAPDLVVHVRREDFVAQAASYALAMRAGVWEGEDRIGADETLALQAGYDRGEITERARDILNQEYHWRQYFHAHPSLSVIETSFEEIAADPDPVVARIAEAFQIALPPPGRRPVPPEPCSVVQAWAAQFEAECEVFVSFWREYRGLISAS
jgi:LPS sulfotransferase NodH